MRPVYAVDIGGLSPSFTTFDSFGGLVNVIVFNAFVLAGIISFMLLVFGGFSVIMGAGSGESKRIESGKKAIVGAVVGLVIVITSVWIVQILGTILGRNLLNPPGP